MDEGNSIGCEGVNPIATDYQRNAATDIENPRGQGDAPIAGDAEDLMYFFHHARYPHWKIHPSKVEDNIVYRLVDLKRGVHFAFFKTLTESDVTVESLRITFDQATLMFPSFSRESFIVNGRGKRPYTRMFQVRDAKGISYNKMTLVGYLGKKVDKNTPARITCDIKGQWRGFVEQNGLRKGDEIYIYRYLLGEEDEYKFVFEVVHNGGN